MRSSQRKSFLKTFLKTMAGRAFFVCFFILAAGKALAADPASWTWDVLVVPPEEGWEKEPGISIRKTLLWHQNRISEEGDGILGHDLQFIFLPPVDEATIDTGIFSPPLTQGTVGIFSFAPSAADELLTAQMRTRDIPLLLAGGEEAFLWEGKQLFPSVFALDLFRDYRCRAFVDYAAQTQPPSARIGVMGARFTLNEAREAQITLDLLRAANFQPLPFWTDPSVSDTFDMLSQEIQNSSNGIIISCAGRMASAEIWRGLTFTLSPYRLWYDGPPDKSFLSYKGMIFADQNIYLDARGGFEQVKRDLWSSSAVAVADTVAAGRANALVLWLTGALSGLNEGSPLDLKALLRNLSRARSIPFGNQTLDIDPTTHRPLRRRVSILEIRDRSFFVLDSIDVTGLGYYEY
ncbi:MAG: hypothetical protein LBR61_05385 [Synergistaceae bacterium]|nr:hypothetical protein [Synergistaceae bacterium]